MLFIQLRHTDFVIFEEREGVEEKKKTNVKVRLDHNALYVDINGGPIRIAYDQTLKKIAKPDRKGPPLTCKPRTKNGWKIEVGVDRREKTFILWINGEDFRSMKLHEEERSYNDAEVARSVVKKSEPGERKKM